MQHRKMTMVLHRGRHRDACFAAFRNNNWLGLVLWVGLVLALAIR